MDMQPSGMVAVEAERTDFYNEESMEKYVLYIKLL